MQYQQLKSNHWNHKQLPTLNCFRIFSISYSTWDFRFTMLCFTTQFLWWHHSHGFVIYFTDMTKASANGTIIPEHNMSLHPYFNFDVQRNVTARVGQTAFLQCRVEQLGDKSVSFFYILSIINTSTIFVTIVVFAYHIFWIFCWYFSVFCAFFCVFLFISFFLLILDIILRIIGKRQKIRNFCIFSQFCIYKRSRSDLFYVQTKSLYTYIYICILDLWVFRIICHHSFYIFGQNMQKN